MSPTPDGVGVNGTGFAALAVSAFPRLCRLAGTGVDGSSAAAAGFGGGRRPVSAFVKGPVGASKGPGGIVHVSIGFATSMFWSPSGGICSVNSGGASVEARIPERLATSVRTTVGSSVAVSEALGALRFRGVGAFFGAEASFTALVSAAAVAFSLALSRFWGFGDGAG